ncbi:redoxin domain-containing protein [Alkalihalobacillus sp. MEB130]|uniref:redoxin domain-containing protein n=1 Tax=Alkalihalobacillus sp. MEB130 TaxID=2976704 RepID=UPI0028DE3A7B|nr:redoxin domain-containing protein [Alkalihalobacillus sp. MEB130]MDT8862909.1 redoxin domain-containing protein [Alkalihalobacillus sp. MEB130]
MDNIWTVGPFIIKQSWIYIALLVSVGIVISHFFINWSNRAKEEREIFGNSIIYFFIVFQFSSLLVNPSISIRDPIAVLSMPSGTTEWVIAVFFLFFYIFWITRKAPVTRVNLFLKLLISYLVVETLYFSFFPYSSNGHNVSFYQGIINISLLLIFYIQQQRDVSARLIVTRLSVLYGGIMGIVSLVINVRMFEATVPSWFYFLIGFAGLVGAKRAGWHDGVIEKKTRGRLVVITIILLMFVGGNYLNMNETTLIEGKKSSSQIAVNQVAPNFTLQTIEGEHVALADFQGKPVMLNFWATWCPPCRAELPDMERFYKNEEVVLLAINGTNTERSIDDVKQFVSNMELSFPVLADETGEISRLFQIGPMPTSIFINERGMITDIHIGAMNEEMMKRKLEAIKE